MYIDSNSRSSGELADTDYGMSGGHGISGGNMDGSYSGVSGGNNMVRRHSRNFTLSPETTDYDSNCGDLDSLSNDINSQTDFGRLYTSMPVLEDGLSSGHASDTENNLSTTMCIDKYLEMAPMENNNMMITDDDTMISECIKKETISTIGQATQVVSLNNVENMMNNTNNCKNFKETNFDLIYSTSESIKMKSFSVKFNLFIFFFLMYFR